MTPLKTIAATAVIAVAGTLAAFGGLHLGQSSAVAATANHPVKARTTYTVSLTAKQLAQLMHGQDNGTAARPAQHVQRTHQRHVSHQGTIYSASAHSNGASTDGHSQQTSHVSSHHHADAGHSGDSSHHVEGSGSHSGGCND